MRTRPSNQQSGAALIEFALVASLLVLLLAGTWELGRAFAYYDALSKATRDGARYMSVAKKAGIKTISVGKAQDLVAAAATAAKVPDFNSSKVLVTCIDSTNKETPDCADNEAPASIRVEIVNYKVSIGQTIPLIGNSVRNIYLTPRTTMRYML
ncbi:TadE/TadG family type IV pilus assembly protein [Pseudoduganella sp. OTU4001]|uniref:TadE/TadG family type IV pilus assembly protein n=1 Tax=Pseudoduganella sp. OTU4001 TaxID=3043854 RepID=UPI00313ADD21